MSKTEEAAVGIANFVVLPMAFLSGSFFALDGAPGWIGQSARCCRSSTSIDGMMDTMVRGEGPWRTERLSRRLLLCGLASRCSLGS